jgi:glyoxylase-like metal-dependent hydrolase (beta-lactamase superfamily II)
MRFRQLFEPESCTFTYLLADASTREAALIDPVLEQVDRYLALLAEAGLTLRYTLETHVHADHVTGASALRDRLGSRSVVHARGGAACADVQVEHGAVIEVGGLALRVLETPGHTDGCVSYAMDDRVFTGDALLIGGCGRTDFQQGDPARLYRSVRETLFSLPGDTLVYPGHYYKGRTVSTIGEERRLNARLGGDRTLASFVELMQNLALPLPKQLDRAVPANQACGVVAGPARPRHEA